MTEKQETVTLHHKDDPKAKVTVTEDQAQAYLATGWVEVAPAPSKDEKK